MPVIDGVEYIEAPESVRRSSTFSFTVFVEPNPEWLGPNDPVNQFLTRFECVAPIPQDLDPTYKWALFPSIIVRVESPSAILSKNGAGLTLYEWYVDGVQINSGFAFNEGWGACFANDPASCPTPMPTQNNDPLDFYYEPGFVWRHFHAMNQPFTDAPDGFNQRTGRPVAIGNTGVPYSWFSELGSRGDRTDLLPTVYPPAEWFYMTPGALPSSCRLVSRPPTRRQGGEAFLAERLALLLIPYSPVRAAGSIVVGAGPSGMRRRGRVSGQGGAPLRIG